LEPSVSDALRAKGSFWKLIQQTKGLDLRWVIIGSLLPDIIDKPIGHIIFKDTFGTGQIYCHTLLFAIFLFLAGYVASSIYKKNFILLLAFGNLMHLILDFMWRKPSILLWPIYGFTFEKSSAIAVATVLLQQAKKITKEKNVIYILHDVKRINMISNINFNISFLCWQLQ